MESAAALWPARNRVFSPRRVFGDFLRVQKVTRLPGRDPAAFALPGPRAKPETRPPVREPAEKRNRPRTLADDA